MYQLLRATGLALLIGSCGDAGPRQVNPDLREVDFLGQTVYVPQHPTRMLASNVGALELLLGVASLDRICSIPAEGYEYSVLGDHPERLQNIHQFATFDAESVLATDPDLVLASDWQSPETCAAIAAAQVPTLRIPTPATWKELSEILLALGRVVGDEPRARDLNVSLRARREALHQRSQSRGKVRALVYSNYGAGGTTAGKGSTWDLIIQTAGLHNAASEAGLDGHPTLDLEALLSLDPDVLLVSAGPAGDSTLAELRSLPRLTGLRPLQSGAIIRLPSTLFATSSQHMLDAAELLVDQLEQL